MFDVQKLTPNDYSEWDNLVYRSSHGTIFHTSDWIQLCCETFQLKPIIFGYFMNGKLFAGCSLYTKKILRIFDVASSACAMTPYGGIMFDNSDIQSEKKRFHVQNEIITSLLKAFSEEKFFDIYLINSPEFNDIRNFIWNNWKEKILYAYYLNLTDYNENKIIRNAKRQIKKGIENNISCQNEIIGVDEYYKLVSQSFEQIHNSKINKDYFKKVIRLIKNKNCGEMWFAETHNGEIIAAEIILWDNHCAYRWSTGINKTYSDSGTSFLLLHSIFKSLKERDFKKINCMAGNTPRFSDFIQNFNPDLIPYYRVEKTKFGFNPIFSIL